jgi:hypothetical protein
MRAYFLKFDLAVKAEATFAAFPRGNGGGAGPAVGGTELR